MKANSRNNDVIAIVGATAAGKTSYAIDLALEFDGEIVSADSRLVYKDLNIGTAKPTKEEQKGVPHYMIDIVSPKEEYSAGLYVKEAKKYINEIFSKGKTPIIVGGTGLYIDTLLMNYDLPKVEPDYELREKLRHTDNLYEILCELDEETAKSIAQNDRKKLIRAIEIVKTTGKKISPCKKEPEFNVKWIGKNFPRDILYKRINDRVDIMMNKGLLEETKFLFNKYGRINNLLYTIGYQEMIEYLDGLLTLDEAVDKLKQNTRRYAKRQLTWFRRNKAIEWDIYPEILKK